MANKENFKILFTRSGGHFSEMNFPDAPMISPPKSLLFLAGLFKNDETVDTSLLDVLAYPDFEKLKDEKDFPPYYFGLSDQAIIDRIKKFNPNVIAVTSTANYYLNDTIKLISLIRNNFPEVFIVVGGPDATNDYKLYFEKTSDFDAIILREGEISFLNLINKIRNGERWQNIKGLAYKENKELILNEPQPYIQYLDDYKPDYSIVDFPAYFAVNRKGYHSRLVYKGTKNPYSIDIVTSRGCPYACSFCCIHLHMGKEFRAHSVNHVIEEMRELIEEYGITNFHFEDDNLLMDKARFNNILRGIIDRGWQITWDTPNGVRADLVDREFLELCNKTGCTYLMLGVESGSKKILDKVIAKDLNLDDVVRAAQLCYEYEIDTLAFYIFGMPGETKEDLLKTYYFAFDLFKKYNTTPMFQLWRPYKNTDMEVEVRDSYNITDPVLYSLHKKYKIPYTLFYSKVYEDEEITMEFLSYYFKKYLKDVARIAFKNWIRIARRNPLVYFYTIAQILFIFIKRPFMQYKTRFMLEEFLTSPGILPFCQLKGKKGKRFVKGK